MTRTTHTLAPHLRDLEAESIHIFREVAAEAEKPVLLYSIGKDSVVLLHIAMKASFQRSHPSRYCMSTQHGNSGR